MATDTLDNDNTSVAQMDDTEMDEEDTPSQSLSVSESNDTGEGGKLKMIIQLVKKAFGVKDIAAM